MKAQKLKEIFDATSKTIEDMGRFKLKLFFAGVASDDGKVVTFKDGSKAIFLNRENRRMTFEVA